MYRGRERFKNPRIKLILYIYFRASHAASGCTQKFLSGWTGDLEKQAGVTNFPVRCPARECCNSELHRHRYQPRSSRHLIPEDPPFTPPNSSLLRFSTSGPFKFSQPPSPVVCSVHLFRLSGVAVFRFCFSWANFCFALRCLPIFSLG